MPQIKEDQLIAEKYQETFNKRQLEAGIKAELKDKHTKSKKRAKKIAKDHLRERPDYYTKLKKAGL
jgi:hypothetical protein